jgi:hypothetical protein
MKLSTSHRLLLDYRNGHLKLENPGHVLEAPPPGGREAERMKGDGG